MNLTATKLGKWGFNFGAKAWERRHEIRAVVDAVQPGVALLLEAAFPLAPDMPPGCLTIGRSVAFMEGFVLPGTPWEAYKAGRQKANEWLAKFGHHPNIKAVQLENEPHADGVVKAACWGAFHAGAADVFNAAGRLFVAGNWAMGTWDCRLNDSGKPLIEACAHATLQWRASFDGIVWGYHGYTDGDPEEGGTDARFLQQRPFALWEPALAFLSIAMPRVVYTEDGFDIGARITTDVPGWRGHWTERRMARLIIDAHQRVPDVWARCFFQAGCADDWRDKGFEVLGASEIIAAMALANRQHPMEEYEMPKTNWDAQEVMDRISLALTGSGWNQHNALAQAFAAHPEVYGVPLSTEIGRDDWPFTLQIGSLRGGAYRKSDGAIFPFDVTPEGIANLPKA